ncbi:MAG TPA: hypothetical protein VKS60_00535 [Stellaceae bacterium]|nr:hypothetical protein [Stellaceae bacterium]
MKRAHRTWHRRIWALLPILLAVLIGAALAVRPPAPPQGEVRAP